ncbi:MAG: hypothetical protein AB7G93_13795 [Bdellovibrionales bacterium]
MKRRDFLNLGVSASAGLLLLKTLDPAAGFAQDKAQKEPKKEAKGTDKADKKEAKKASGPEIPENKVVHEGKPTNLPNYCEHPEKQPNKYCPGWKEGHCKTCMFYDRQNMGTSKGKEVAKCKVATNPQQPQYVYPDAYCSSYVKDPKAAG